MNSIFIEWFWVNLFVLIPLVLFVFSSEICYELHAVEINWGTGFGCSENELEVLFLAERSLQKEVIPASA